MSKTDEEKISSAICLFAFVFLAGCIYIGTSLVLASKNIDIDTIIKMGDYELEKAK
jgi:hypothetical protein